MWLHARTNWKSHTHSKLKTKITPFLIRHTHQPNHFSTKRDHTGYVASSTTDPPQNDNEPCLYRCFLCFSYLFRLVLFIKITLVAPRNTNWKVYINRYGACASGASYQTAFTHSFLLMKMCSVQALRSPCGGGIFQNIECGTSTVEKKLLGFVNFHPGFNAVGSGRCRKRLSKPITAKEDHESSLADDGNGASKYQGIFVNERNCVKNEPDSSFTNHSSAFSGTIFLVYYYC